MLPRCRDIRIQRFGRLIPTLTLLAVAMSAFAANSLVCRLALRTHLIDAASFTSVRLTSGAAMLLLLLVMRRGGMRPVFDPIAALALFSYAICFSFAYVALDAGTGALLLFAAVQLTMIGVGILRGERPRASIWVGLATASAGLIYLLTPGIAAPSPGPATLMVLAGIAWGAYSLRGAGHTDPVGATAWNFVLATPLALLTSLMTSGTAQFTMAGIGWAIFSGAFASGFGYIVWYRALPSVSTVAAATVQLSVPLFAALGGVWLLDERFSNRLGIASVVILGGIGLVIGARRRR